MPTSPPPLFHGTRAALSPGDLLPPQGGAVACTPSLDAAIWAAELAEGEGRPAVYRVTPTGPCEEAAAAPGAPPPPFPTMTWRSAAPLRVVEEVTQWRYFHGTRAVLRPGELLVAGHASNFGPTPRSANFVYFTRTLDAATWGAELATGEGPGRIYVVEPTGPFEDDPNLTNARFRGNPTGSYRSRAALRVVGELEGWTGHAPEQVRAMKEALARLDQAGVEPDDG